MSDDNKVHVSVDNGGMGCLSVVLLIAFFYHGCSIPVRILPPQKTNVQAEAQP